MSSQPWTPPLVDISRLVHRSGREEHAAWQAAGAAIGDACERYGFFYVTGHGVSAELAEAVEGHSRAFFALAHEEKMRIRMALGGRAWRGFFPVGDELTSGRPDQKEGIYFGAEQGEDHPDVLARRPLCGANLFPERPAQLRPLVLEYMEEMTRLGHLLMRAVAMSLALEPDYFDAYYTRDPTTLFRIFHYPGLGPSGDATLWSVGEHTDYGLLTILKQDRVGGLQIRTGDSWIEAAPIEGTFICNIGDMLDALTLGRYRSTPHRVVNRSTHSRLSLAFFFDPAMSARIRPLPTQASRTTSPDNDVATRWDGRSPYELSGTYGDYLLDKVSRVFPDLSRRVD